ncbi:unnamed protein product [Cyclocybe aegerita]|uniref:SnoaL-like domain-containing protein n=1 Tax=Cyclocybe aegerita TaxID=1973307 RepID=A0A8S0VVM2_CYCAE|nr:unnamed protein product [Cyclocybe aegerita]
MHFASVFAIVAAAALTITSSFAAKCSRTAPATDRSQLWTLKDFANSLFVEKNVQKAYDDWIPGSYINHNADVVSGRENALAFLRPIFSNPDLKSTIASIVVGQGFGFIHHRLTIPGQADWAVMDRFGFNGTCIVEHWDVIQPITGDETNPIAYF